MTAPVGSYVTAGAGGLRWQIRPELQEKLLGPGGLRLAEWLREGQARLVKHGPHRAVYHVTLPGLRFYLKHYPLTDVRAWLRQLLRPAKARTEFTQALAIAERGVPTVVPLALGEHPSGPGESFLLTQTLDGADPLGDFLERHLGKLPGRRHALIRQRVAWVLGELVAGMHAAGIAHDDLHANNMLIRLGPDDRPHIHVIDLHNVRVGPPLLRWRQRRANLVLINRWFLTRASRADRARFWHAYCRAYARLKQAHFAAALAPVRADRDPNSGESGDALANRLTPLLEGVTADATRPTPRRLRPVERRRARDTEQRTWRSSLTFWRHRDRRCLGTNRYYREFDLPSGSGHAVRDLEDATLAAFFTDPDAAFTRPGATVLKDSRSSTVAEVEVTVHGEKRRAIYKRFRATSWTDPWAALVRPTPALRSWLYGQGLRERCLPTARPLAVFHRRHRGLCYEGYLLIEKIPNAVDLRAFLTGLQGLPAAERRQLLLPRLEQVARLVLGLHQRNLSHRDLKAANILLTEQGPWLIDLVGVQDWGRLGRRRKVQNLARLCASFLDHPGLTRTDRLRFLRVYLQWGVKGKTGWKRWWRQIEGAARAKAARNARVGRVLA